MDADFCGNWDKDIAPLEPDTARSRHGLIIKLFGVPIYWQSKLQTQFALSTAESELLGLRSRYVKSIMYLVEEINEKVVGIPVVPIMHCRLFEDNMAALEMAKIPKLRLRTRHINVAYQHLASEVASKRLLLQTVGNLHQQADYLTKSCDVVPFERHQKSVQRW